MSALELGRSCGSGTCRPSLGGFLEQRADARVRVLHVEDRVLGGLLDGQIEIELELAVAFAHEKEEARRVGADFVHHFAQGDELARALAHAHRLAAARQAHELDDQHAQLAWIAAERLQSPPRRV